MNVRSITEAALNSAKTLKDLSSAPAHQEVPSSETKSPVVNKSVEKCLLQYTVSVDVD